MMPQHDTSPSATRARSYSGGYMAVAMQAEAILLEYLWQRPGTLYVEDVRAVLQWQAVDVDFRVLVDEDGRSGRWVDVEGKSDQHLDRSGNWLFELFRVNHTAPLARIYVPGWSVRSAASELLFYAPSTHRIHSIAMTDYRLACANAVRVGACRYDEVQTDAIKTTINAYFPERYALGMPSYRVTELKAPR